MTVLALLLAVAAAGPAAGRGDDVVASVDGAAITRSLLSARLEAFRAENRTLSTEQALDTLVAESLLAAEGRRTGLAGSREVGARVEAAVRKAAGAAFTEEIAAKAAIDEATLRELFHATADFARLELLAFATRDDALAAAGRLARGSSFQAESRTAVVARVYASPSAAPLVMRAELEAPLASALFQAERGAVVGPVQLTTGWAVARALERVLGTEAEFAARRASLDRAARKRVAAEWRRHLVEQLLARGTTRVDEDFLRALPAAGATARQLDQAVATVDGKVIRYREIHASVRALGGGGHLGGPTVRIQLAWQEVRNRLFEEAAVAEGYARSAAVTSRAAEFERTALAQEAAARIRDSARAPSKEEIERFYRRNAARYGKPLLEVLPEASEGAAEEKRIEALAARLERLRRDAKVSIDRAALARGGSE